jgi:hypothetical protein
MTLPGLRGIRVCVPKALTRTIKLKQIHQHRDMQRERERERERERDGYTHTHSLYLSRGTTQASIPEPISSTNQPRRLVTVGASCCSESRPVAAHPPHAHARAKDAGMSVCLCDNLRMHMSLGHTYLVRKKMLEMFFSRKKNVGNVFFEKQKICPDFSKLFLLEKNC